MLSGLYMHKLYIPFSRIVVWNIPCMQTHDKGMYNAGSALRRPHL